MLMSRLVLLGLLVATLLLCSEPAPLPSGTGRSPPCSTTLSELTPCMNYITGKEAKPSSGCCNGVKQIATGMQSKEDRAAACVCIQNALTKSKLKYNPSLISTLPKQCSVAMSIPAIDANTDCSKAFKSTRVVLKSGAGIRMVLQQ